MAEIGDYVHDPRCGATAVRLVAPDTCPNGHDLTRRRSATVSWVRCHCDTASPTGGHHTWYCWVCREKVYGPPCSDPAPQARLIAGEDDKPRSPSR